MVIVCPKCQKQGQVKGGDELIGRKSKCPACGEIFAIIAQTQLVESEPVPQVKEAPSIKQQTYLKQNIPIPEEIEIPSTAKPGFFISEKDKIRIAEARSQAEAPTIVKGKTSKSKTYLGVYIKTVVAVALIVIVIWGVIFALSKKTSSDKEAERTVSFAAVSGAVIVGQNGNTVKYKEKCDACGNVGNSTRAYTSGGGTALTSSSYCHKCKKTYNSRIECY